MIPTLILTAGLVLSAKISPAKPEYTRRTHKDCEFCHPPDYPCIDRLRHFLAVSFLEEIAQRRARDRNSS